MNYSDYVKSNGLGHKRPTKAQANIALRAYIDQHGLPEYDSNLADLVAFFLPPVPKKPKSAFQWIASAAGVKDIRQWVNYVHVTNGQCFATDGHRLHIMLSHLDEGVYLPSGQRADESVQELLCPFDRVERLFPTEMPAEVAINDSERTEDSEILVYMQEKCAINAKFLDAARAYPGETPSYHWEDCENTPLFLYFKDDRRAIVMPMRT